MHAEQPSRATNTVELEAIISKSATFKNMPVDFREWCIEIEH